MTRRGRDGEPLDDDELEPLDEAHECERGWLAEDAEGRPRPCLRCRPHIEEGRRRLHSQLVGPNLHYAPRYPR